MEARRGQRRFALSHVMARARRTSCDLARRGGFGRTLIEHLTAENNARLSSRLRAMALSGPWTQIRKTCWQCHCRRSTSSCRGSFAIPVSPETGLAQPRLHMCKDSAKRVGAEWLRKEGHVLRQLVTRGRYFAGTHNDDGRRPALSDIVSERDTVHGAGHLDVSE